MQEAMDQKCRCLEATHGNLFSRVTFLTNPKFNSFATIDLPAYSTKEILAEKLMLAISEGKEGFGFL